MESFRFVQYKTAFLVACDVLVDAVQADLKAASISDCFDSLPGVILCQGIKYLL